MYLFSKMPVWLRARSKIKKMHSKQLIFKIHFNESICSSFYFNIFVVAYCTCLTAFFRSSVEEKLWRRWKNHIETVENGETNGNKSNRSWCLYDLKSMFIHLSNGILNNKTSITMTFCVLISGNNLVPLEFDIQKKFLLLNLAICSLSV